MSKLGGFWGAGSSSDSESSSSSDSDRDVAVAPSAARTTGRFQVSGSSSDSEEVVREAKSKTDRAWDVIRECVTKIRNTMKNGDWVACEEAWKECNKKMSARKTMIAEKGLPGVYVKMLTEVEDTLQGLNKETLRKMKPVVGKAAANMKTVTRKHNVAYKADMDDLRANPSKYEEADSSDSDSDDSSDSDSDSDSDSSAAEDLNKKTVPAKAAVPDDDSDSEDSLFGNDSDSDSSDDEIADGRGELKGRARWLKKTTTVTKKVKAKPTATAANKPKEEAKVATTVRRTQVQDVVLTIDELNKRLSDLIASRGRKGTDAREVLRKLEVLSRGARKFGSKNEIPVLMHLISSMYDGARGIDDFMDVQQWRTCYRSLARITALLHASPELSLGPISTEDDTDLVGGASKATMWKGSREEKDENEAKSTGDPNVIRVVGSLGGFVSRLGDEYTKALQQINPHTSEYVTRLSDEAFLIELAQDVYTYYKRVGDNTAGVTMALLHIEHIYYKHDTVSAAVARAHVFNKKWGRFADVHPSCTSKMSTVMSDARDSSKIHPATFAGYPIVETPEINPSRVMSELSQFIFKNGDERIKTRALLCTVFHHALHDRFYRARDLFLISHIQDVIDKADAKTQILYNRVLACLGLSAFREGLIQKAHDCLQNICSGRPKELLAQGQARWADRDPEQERQERRRLIPYHMHINPDLLDTCYLTCAMLLELPYMARGMTAVNPVNQNVVSRQFRKFMQNYNRQVFTGPPENTREHVMAAAKSMLVGDWEKASGYILGLEVWNLIPNGGGAAVKAMLEVKLKEEAVRTYLLSSGVSAYSSLSLQHLCDTFDIQSEPCRRIISRMIFNKEISAAWEAGATLVLHKVESSSTQTLSIKLAEKVASLVDTNERLLDSINGGQMFGQNDWGGRDTRGKWQGDQQGNRRYQKSGAVGRGGGDYGNKGGYRDNRDNRGKGGYQNRGHNQNRGNHSRQQNSNYTGGNAHDNQQPKQEHTKNVWGQASATPKPSAWGATQ